MNNIAGGKMLLFDGLIEIDIPALEVSDAHRHLFAGGWRQLQENIARGTSTEFVIASIKHYAMAVERRHMEEHVDIYFQVKCGKGKTDLSKSISMSVFKGLVGYKNDEVGICKFFIPTSMVEEINGKRYIPEWMALKKLQEVQKRCAWSRSNGYERFPVDKPVWLWKQDFQDRFIVPILSQIPANGNELYAQHRAKRWAAASACKG